ncbi:META domain-containing protein [Prolixibacteraceae bacterium Z1-6]|uniref:META domain-containing protein n=1 Tax=Draconibacterium aestuarii TaxID=2998507 RepID=A0A9X3J8J2_9BACT|nr:META domain-containing protein [Prolixibacteraceae bacterium Z1-6]
MKNIWLLGLIFLGISCSSVKNSHNYTYLVNSYTVNCTGVGPMDCMLIKKGDKAVEGEWENFYSKIEGFEYEPGYIYKLQVREEKLENVPADASSIKYTLVKVLEKKVDTKLLLNGTWDIAKINGSAIEAGTGGIPQLQIDTKEMSVSGSDGCNRLKGSIKKIENDAIEFTPMAGTQMMCPNMTNADKFNKTFAGVKKFEVENNTLTFFNEAGNAVLEFFKGSEPKQLINDIWVAEFIRGESLPGDLPRIEIHSADMRILGTDGCNNFKGQLTKLTNTELEVGLLAGTRMMCPDMTNADKFNSAINNVKTYKIANLRLSLFDSEGRQLMLLKKID